MTNNIHFLKEKVLVNNTNVQNKDVEERLKYIRREKTLNPIIYVGTGTCGIIAGANHSIKQIKEYIKDNKITAEIVEVGCIGFCSAEPIIDIQLPGKTRLSFKNVTSDKIIDILDSVFNNNVFNENVLGQYKQENLQLWENVPLIDNIPFLSLQKRIVLDKVGIIDPNSIEEYIATNGYKAFIKTIYNYTSIDICKIINKSELRESDGLGTFIGEKLKIAHNTASDQRYLICNANQSDPELFIDRLLLESNPHKIIESIAIAAYGIRSSKAFLFIKSINKNALNRINFAIEQAKGYGLLGENIFDSGYNLEIIVKQYYGSYFCGEETALISSIEGKKWLPKSNSLNSIERGLYGKPTVIINLETLCKIPHIITNGPQWYNTIGTKTSKGTKIFSLTGKTRNTGFIEVPMGITFYEIIYNLGNGLKNNNDFKALLIGGPEGNFLSNTNLNMEIDYESLKIKGINIGSGGLITLDKNYCIVELAKYYLELISNESCGKCIACREGIYKIYEIINNITKRPKNEKSHQTLERFKGIMQIESIADVIKDTSACSYGKNSPNIFLSSLKEFLKEYEEHIFDRKCKAGVCKELRVFTINTEKCTGCNACFKKCITNAIIGTIKYPHFIIEEKCIGCGTCIDTCMFSAISLK